jgi:hypothetical protein
MLHIIGEGESYKFFRVRITIISQMKPKKIFKNGYIKISDYWLNIGVLIIAIRPICGNNANLLKGMNYNTI